MISHIKSRKEFLSSVYYEELHCKKLGFYYDSYQQYLMDLYMSLSWTLKQLPKVLTVRIHELYGERSADILHAFSGSRIGSFRINTLRNLDNTSFYEDIAREFKEKGIPISPFPDRDTVYTFSREHEYAVKGTRAFYEGKIYLQSITSMLPALILDPKPWEYILDVCAAPGSKTTLLSTLMKNTWLITAIEKNQIRMDKLRYNIHLQGAKNIHCVKQDAHEYCFHTKEYFDRILLDAPCSAEGRISLIDPRTYGFWSLRNIEEKARLQYTLLEASLKVLKPWGTLIYSTCTLAPEENEAVITDALNQFPSLKLDRIEHEWKCIPTIPWIKEFWGIHFHREISRTLRILPSISTEWFFIAKMSL